MQTRADGIHPDKDAGELKALLGEAQCFDAGQSSDGSA
jgi:hypothetical protein